MARASHLRPVRSARPAPEQRRTQFEYGESYLMGEAARLFYVVGLPQKAVAERLSTSQTTISRLISRAREEGIVEFFLRPGPEHGLANELQEKFRHTCVKRFVVVPGGSGINEGNLAGPAAALILRELKEREGTKTRITAAGGRTMHAVFESLIRGFQPMPDWSDRERVLEFYPAVLSNDPWIDLSYPATLAATLALSVHRKFGADYSVDDGDDRLGGSVAKRAGQVEIDPRLHIRACTLSLPAPFYTFKPKERAECLDRFGYRALMEEALAAEIFVVGIGTAAGKRYREIISAMGAKMGEHLGKAVAEMCWVPLTTSGEPVSEIADDLVAIKPHQLRDRAARGLSSVIAVAGGSTKLDSVEAAMINPCFSTLVCDVVNARRLMQSTKVGIQR